MEEVRLHLGAGWRRLHGWLQVDSTKYDHIDIVGPVDDLRNFEDESVSEIYASHVLEYFDDKNALATLSEWRRVLRPGGELRLAVPDFRSLVQIYIQTGSLSSILGPLFGRMKSDAGLIFHRTVFDRSKLEALLLEAGYSEVYEYNPVEFLASIDPNYDDHSLAFFPHMDQSGVQVSLCLRAIK